MLVNRGNTLKEIDFVFLLKLALYVLTEMQFCFNIYYYVKEIIQKKMISCSCLLRRICYIVDSFIECVYWDIAWFLMIHLVYHLACPCNGRSFVTIQLKCNSNAFPDFNISNLKKWSLSIKMRDKQNLTTSQVNFRTLTIYL